MISFQFITAFLLILIGLYGLMYKTNLIKMLISLTILDGGINLLLISLGYVHDGTAPIFTGFEKGMIMVNPLPQALVLTAIVIGICVIALALSLVIQIYRHYGTLDVREIRKLKE